ncbi:MAG TPA: elongation factor P [Kiloniellales bacterium]|nr:elongation factor P [Kiloniellales bacterium]
MKVNASALRSGNVVEMDDKLFVILKAENIQPGKGTPVTQLEMRRLSDGVKVSERFRTTEQVERAFIEEQDYQFLYDEGEAYAFMQTETFEQVSVPKDIIGEQGIYLQEGMVVQVSLHEGVPVSVSLPQRVVLEVVETEPVIKNQTATSSFKPAVLSNGVRTGVPSHVSVGARIVVNTADGSYIERSRD